MKNQSLFTILRAQFYMGFIFIQIITIPLIAFAGVTQISINDSAPSIRLRGMDNKLVFIDDILKTKPMVISFFFADCVNCVKEMPGLSALQKKYGDSIQFYLISTDASGAEAVAPYIATNSIIIQVLLDKYSDTARAWGVEKYPALFVVGRDRKIIYVSNGYHEDTVKKLDAVLNKIKRVIK